MVWNPMDGDSCKYAQGKTNERPFPLGYKRLSDFTLHQRCPSARLGFLTLQTNKIQPGLHLDTCTACAACLLCSPVAKAHWNKKYYFEALCPVMESLDT
eukprot:632684-Pelagomonas_calceolata.AAC.6